MKKMGLLTNPSISQKASYSKYLIQYKGLICGVLYLAGVIHFCLLPDNNLNSGTYFSENALLPGLVYSEIKTDTVSLAKTFHAELERERETHKNGMPYAWLLLKMRKIGLETHTHNFTLNYPLRGGKIFKGKNVYGILRAPRIGSTESIVISVPYRPPDSFHPDITHGLSLILAFADFARRQKYWAKDIIFLITEHEQLGMQAWLEAYHGYNENSILNSGSLNARAGAIQAAINLEVQDFDIEFINLKIEGLNGQLPNLDLHNLVQKLSHKQGITSAYKLSTTNNRRGYRHSDKLLNMLSMVLTQASGVPTGNHGLFHKYGIEALTLECHKRSSTNYQKTQAGIAALLKIIEGISRSLNNLLERFHQSFFFYIMVSHDRFVSIGDYMISLGLMAGTLLIKAFILWLTINREMKEEQEKEDAKSKNLNYLQMGIIFLAAHSIGVLMSYLPLTSMLDQFLHANNVSTQEGLIYVVLFVSVVSFNLPVFCSLNDFENEFLHIAVLLELGTALIAVGILNISLGLMLSVGIVPFALMVNPRKSGALNGLSRLLCFILQPLCAAYLIISTLTWFTFPELSVKHLFFKAVVATIDAITFSVVDSMIYGNWLFDLISIIFFPSWILFWIVLFPKTGSPKNNKLKTN